MKLLTALSIAAALLFAASASAKDPHSIESLERERAAMINAMVSDKFDAQTRSLQIKGFFRRLTDIERMVLRDDRLLGLDNATVKNAFNHYDLTFMVHASAEAQSGVTDHWLNQVGLSTSSLFSTRVGRR